MDNAKEIYMNDICSFEKDERMREFHRKEFSGMCRFDDGAYIVFDKPSIKTNFCFGYGMYLRSTAEEEKLASDMAFHASTSEDYFIEKNLERLKSLRESVLDDRYKMYIHCHYIHEPDDCNLKGYGFCKFFEEPYSNLRAVRYLSESERNKVAEVIDVEIAKFTKRLRTYLKRYGLSKVNSWSYLVD